MNAHRIAALIALLAFAAPEVLAQQPTPLTPGARVRVGVPTTADHRGWRITSVEHLIGTVTALRSDTLFVDVGGASPTPVALSRVSTVEISQGTKSNAGKGALIGGLVGAALGGVAMAGAGSALARSAGFSGWGINAKPGGEPPGIFRVGFSVCLPSLIIVV